MNNSERAVADQNFRGHWWGYALAIFVVYTLAGPLLTYARPASLYTIGLMAGATVFAGHWSGRHAADWDGKLARWISLIFLCASCIMSGPIINDALDAAHANERRCRTLQQDMLSTQPRVANGYDVFQALGCKPQGSDDRIMVKPTDRERAAGRALPWGGYPPRADR